jgi:hypothetical protein
VGISPLFWGLRWELFHFEMFLEPRNRGGSSLTIPRIAFLNVNLSLPINKFKFCNHTLSRRISNLRLQMKRGYLELVRYPPCTHVFHLCSTLCPDSCRQRTAAGSNPVVPVNKRICQETNIFKMCFARRSLISLWRGMGWHKRVTGFWYQSCLLPCRMRTHPASSIRFTNSFLFTIPPYLRGSEPMELPCFQA